MMIVSDTIKDIESYLIVNPLAKPKKSGVNLPKFSGGVGAYAAIGAVGLIGSVVAGPLNNPNGMLENVLSHCTDEQLDELMAEYGEDSDLGKIICRKRSEQYVSKTCSVEKIANELESLIKPKMGENSFYRSVCYYMNRIGFDNDADFYNKIGMPRQLFAKIRDPKNTLSKKTVLWIIVGLKVTYNEANDLLRKAGYSFRKSDLRDVVLSYIFRNTDYDLWKVNEVLTHFDLEPFC